jgi:hypothetical protein
MNKESTEKMPEESTTQSPPSNQPQVEFVVPDPEGGIFTTYANNLQVGFTLFDIRMVFGEVVDAQPDKIVVEQRAQVTISYLQAKMLVMILAKAIAAQEARVGEIRIPEGVFGIQIATTEAKMPPGTFTRP